MLLQQYQRFLIPGLAVFTLLTALVAIVSMVILHRAEAWRRGDSKFNLALAGLIAVTFCLDAFSPVGVADWLLYLLPLVLCYRGRPWFKPLVIAAVCASLTALGHFISPTGDEWVLDITNRLMVIPLYWIVALFISWNARSAEALLASEIRYHRLFESARDGILIIDAKTGTILDANPFLTGMLGLSRENIAGKKAWEVGSLKPLFTSQSTFEEWRREEAHRRENRVLETADGRRIEVEFISTTYESNAAKMIQCSLRDITDRKRAEAEIIELNVELDRRVRDRTAQLEASNRELDAFSYSVSHDLRAPLRAIHGFAHILQEDFAPQLPPEMVRHLNVICKEAVRMELLIDELLNFSRLYCQPLHLQIVSATELVSRAREQLDEAEDGRCVEITVGELPTGLGDPGLLLQVWVNLLSNAIKYTGPREVAKIVVGGHAEDNEVIYFVRDNGVGFDMKYVDKLYGVFQRLHTSKEFEGTGVGLALVQRIVHRHGGRVWAEGKVNEGSTFYFSLPNPKGKHEH